MGRLVNIARRAAGGSPLSAIDLLQRSAGIQTRATLADPSQAMREAWTSGTTATGAKVTPQTALAHGDVYACIRALSDAAGSLPLHVYSRDDAGGHTRAPKSPQGRLMRRPHPLLTQSALNGMIVAHLNGWGNAYIGKIRDRRGEIVRLWPIHPSRVSVEVKAGEPSFTVSASGEDRQAGVFNRADILHIKGLTDDGIIGLSPISQAREVLGLGITMAAYAGRFFDNSAYPGGVIKVQGELSEGAAQRLRQDWDRFHRGVKNTARTAVLEGGADFEAITVSPQDAQFVEQRRLSTTEIARIFRVPPWMIAADAGSSMTYSNVEQQMIQFAVYSLRPWLVAIEQAFAADDDLFPADGSVFCEFLMDAILRADTATRTASYTAAHGRWMTTNEIRARENLPRVDDGDVLLHPSEVAARRRATEDGGA